MVARIKTSPPIAGKLVRYVRRPGVWRVLGIAGIRARVCRDRAVGRAGRRELPRERGLLDHRPARAAPAGQLRGVKHGQEETCCDDRTDGRGSALLRSELEKSASCLTWNLSHFATSHG